MFFSKRLFSFILSMAFATYLHMPNQSLAAFDTASGSVSNFHKRPPKRIKILAIDGGGIRGLIPALVLKNLEGRLKNGKSLVDCFDVMSGTSTGGIIVLLLAAPSADGGPKYNINTVLQLYEDLGREVFKDTLWQKITSGFGWVDAKYSEKPLEALIAKYLEDVELKDTLTNVIVPAYEIEKDVTFFFKTSKAKIMPERNYKLKDLARSTSAAPTYFRPAIIRDMTGKHTYTLVDGGVSVNNPALAATVHAVELFGYDNHFFIVSLGTGTNFGASKKNIPKEEVRRSGLFQWAKRIVSVMMYAVNAVTDYEMLYVFNNTHPDKDYYRLQATLEPEDSDMDNASPENVKKLEQYAEKLIKDNEALLQKIADVLNED